MLIDRRLAHRDCKTTFRFNYEISMRSSFQIPTQNPPLIKSFTATNRLLFINY